MPSSDSYRSRAYADGFSGRLSIEPPALSGAYAAGMLAASSTTAAGTALSEDSTVVFGPVSSVTDWEPPELFG